ncbi:MAG: tripartite tricarboxylate transporter substrate-binding protein [Proteobacteria bacterium]|nr:tripartite tricarboxylate transporter substrate-binding protein [Pseudomonadota bacterium]
MKTPTGLIAGIVLAIGASAVTGKIATAETPAEFYTDNVITTILGAGPGGGYDVYARTVMKHLVKHIPGKPKYIVQFMPGAGGLKAANYFYSVSAADGSKVAKLSNMLPAFQVLKPGVKYDVRKLNFIGRAASMQYVTMVWHTTGVKNLADLAKAKTPVIFGASGLVQSNYIVPAVMQKLLGLNVKVIAGYPSTASINQALEKGEVTGRAGAWSSWLAAGAHLVNSGQVVAIAQSGLEKATDIKDGYGQPTPLLLDLAKNDDDRAILRLLASDAAMGRNFSVPPGTPKDRVEALCRAFDATMKDPAFHADAKKRKLIVEPKTCEWLHETATAIVSTPRPLIEKARTLLGWK